MTTHEKVAGLLALSAAGLLDPDEQRIVKSHLHECPECSARAAEFERLSTGLAILPRPTPPPFLAARTQARLAAAADRRQGALLALLAALIAWTMSLMSFASWSMFRAVTPGAVIGWAAWSVVLPLLTVPAAAALIRRARPERSVL